MYFWPPCSQTNLGAGWSGPDVVAQRMLSFTSSAGRVSPTWQQGGQILFSCTFAIVYTFSFTAVVTSYTWWGPWSGSPLIQNDGINISLNIHFTRLNPCSDLVFFQNHRIINFATLKCCQPWPPPGCDAPWCDCSGTAGYSGTLGTPPTNVPCGGGTWCGRRKEGKGEVFLNCDRYSDL